MTEKRKTTTVTKDERAVSPVIGVILMVAITVILAAVIGTFVLDLGQSAGQSAPQASLSVSVSASADTVSVEHGGGDPLDASTIRVRVEAAPGNESIHEPATSSTEKLTAGESFTIESNGTVTGWSIESDTGIEIDPGDTIEVTIIHTESQRVVFETTVTA